MKMKVEKLTDEKWLNLYKAKWIDKDGKNRDWLFSSRKYPTLEENPFNHAIRADAVIIVPIIQNRWTDTGNQLVITREWRAPLNGYEYGFPAGLLDPGELAGETAYRELKEETGLTIDYIVNTSPVVFSSIGMTDEAICYVHAMCSGEITDEFLEDDEDIFTKAFDIDQLINLYYCSSINWSAKAWPYVHNFVNNRKIDF